MRSTPRRRFFTHLLPVLVIMALIFWFSHQDREETLLRTGTLARICAWLGADCAWIMQGAKAFYIRKAAHMTEYAALGFFVLRWLRLSRAPAPAFRLALIFGVLYACSDEFHQSFIPGRGPSIYDVMIDSAGLLIGLFLWRIWERWRNKKRR